MALSRFSAALRGAFARGAGFGIARRLFRGFSIDSITSWLVGAFGTMGERELLELVEHGRQMRAAGQSLSELSPGARLSLDQVPVNPWLSPSITEGSRSVSELILPWQNLGTEQEGEWYHRFRFIDVISVDEIQQSIDTWVAGITGVEGSPPLDKITQVEFIVGQFVGVGVERVY